MEVCQMPVYIKKLSYFQRFQVCLDFRLIVGRGGGGNPGKGNFHHLFQPFGLGGVTFHGVFNGFSIDVFSPWLSHCFPVAFHGFSMIFSCPNFAAPRPPYSRAGTSACGLLAHRSGRSRRGGGTGCVEAMNYHRDVHIIGIDYCTIAHPLVVVDNRQSYPYQGRTFRNNEMAIGNQWFHRWFSLIWNTLGPYGVCLMLGLLGGWDYWDLGMVYIYIL